MLTKLQRADVSDDGPAISGRELIGITWHSAKAVRYHVIEVSNGRGTQTVDVIRRWLSKPSLDYHASTIADTAVADRTINVESIFSTIKYLACDWKWKLTDIGNIVRFQDRTRFGRYEPGRPERFISR
jgi:hypothetical protein